jgi:protein O-GlcNAc transferase
MNKKTHSMVQRAIQLFQNSKFEMAESILVKVCHIDNKNFVAFHVLGLLKAIQRKNEEAIQLLSKAASINSNDASIQYNLAKTLSDFGNKDDAIIHYDQAIALKPNYVEAWINKGFILNELGRYEGVVAHYDRALSLNPDFVDAWLNKGNALFELKRYEGAIANYDRALSLNANLIQAWSNKGNALFELKRYQEAIAHLDQALSLNPDFVDAWLNKGNVLSELKRYEEAIAHYDRALSLNPDFALAWSNKGNALFAFKRYEEAITHYDRALSLNPDFALAWSNKGNALNELKCYEDAIIYLDQALSLSPDFVEAWSNKGNALNKLKCYEDAIIHLDQALSLSPDFAEAWSNKGNAVYELKRYEEAIAHYDKALSLKPDYAEAWSNKGNPLYELKRYDEAIAHYDKALSLKPDYAEAWSNKGNALNELKRYDEALAHYDRALSLKPDIDWVLGDWLRLKMKICSWSEFEKSFDLISEKLIANENVTSPFPFLSLTDDGLLHKKSSEIYVQSKYPSNSVLGPILRHSNNQKIRVGYFSADFHNHATGYLMAELFELQDKSKFELIGFSFGPIANDGMRQRLEKSFDQFIEVGGKSDVEIAKLSRELNIDIAVDLKGFTQDARTGIFAYRAAPIQVNYLGYPGSLGVDYIDYIIADKTLIPPQSQELYSEKVVYLPNSYQVNDRKRVISERQFTRKELGLPEHSFVFCCFNNNYKILPATFASWMKILKSVKGSVLWLYKDNYWAKENLKKEAEKNGISANRLVFAESLPIAEHLARHRQANLFLDNFPYNAHTTASDALWAGLPILTLMGESFASRVAASLLNAVGLPELITSFQEEYEALAIELANNTQRLEEINLKLANNRLTSPLFDTPLFTKNLEAAFVKMYENYQAGIEPNDIFI